MLLEALADLHRLASGDLLESFVVLDAGAAADTSGLGEHREHTARAGQHELLAQEAHVTLERQLPTRCICERDSASVGQAHGVAFGISLCRLTEFRGGIGIVAESVRLHDRHTLPRGRLDEIRPRLLRKVAAHEFDQGNAVHGACAFADDQEVALGIEQVGLGERIEVRRLAFWIPLERARAAVAREVPLIEARELCGHAGRAGRARGILTLADRKAAVLGQRQMRDGFAQVLELSIGALELCGLLLGEGGEVFVVALLHIKIHRLERREGAGDQRDHVGIGFLDLLERPLHVCQFAAIERFQQIDDARGREGAQRVGLLDPVTRFFVQCHDSNQIGDFRLTISDFWKGAVHANTSLLRALRRR